MSLTALVSVKGAPWVTTTGLVLAAAAAERGPALFVEADPSGGVVAARAGLSLHATLGTLVQHRRELTAEQVARACQMVGGVPTLAAEPTGATVAAALASLDGLPVVLAQRPGLTMVDCGRLGAQSPARPLVAAADTVLVLCHTGFAELEATRLRLASLSARRAVVLLVGSERTDAEAAEYLRHAVAGRIPVDPESVALLYGVVPLANKGLARRPLARWARTAVDHLVATAAEVAVR